MQGNTIDEVIDQLGYVIDWSKKNRSRMGYFAALYRRVTIRVKEKIEEGYFEDGKRMEKLDVVFANRYLIAWSVYQKRQKASASWECAFDATGDTWLVLLQHLFLGMNAHISLDLGISAAQVAPKEAIHTLQGDFNRINEVLGSLVDEVQDEIAAVWPAMRMIDRMGWRMEEGLANFSMKFARNAAWKVATEAAALSPDELPIYIQQKDAEVTRLSHKIINPGFLPSFLLRLVRLGEFGSVEHIIEVLSRNQSS